MQTLSVFRSAATEEFDAATSDIDFLVLLEPPEGVTRFDAFFGLKEALEKLLSRPVDLVDPSALQILRQVGRGISPRVVCRAPPFAAARVR